MNRATLNRSSGTRNLINILILGSKNPAPMLYSGYYSVLKLFTGFDNAAFVAWKLMVAIAIKNAIMPAMANTQTLILMRYA